MFLRVLTPYPSAKWAEFCNPSPSAKWAEFCNPSPSAKWAEFCNPSPGAKWAEFCNPYPGAKWAEFCNPSPVEGGEKLHKLPINLHTATQFLGGNSKIGLRYAIYANFWIGFVSPWIFPYIACKPRANFLTGKQQWKNNIEQWKLETNLANWSGHVSGMASLTCSSAIIVYIRNSVRPSYGISLDISSQTTTA